MSTTTEPSPPLMGQIDAWRDDALADDRRHGPRPAALLGLALGVSFTVCFATGLLSHLIQHPTSWFTWFPRPAGLYRVTQGLHVATGIAAIPLLFTKLWAVFPHLLRTPVVRDVADGLERLSLLPLVGGSIFLLVTGVANIELFYPWPFFFPAGHHAVAWIVIGALIVHVGAKLSTTRDALARRAGPPLDEPIPAGRQATTGGDGLDRRRLLLWAAGGSAVLTVATIGQTVAPLRGLALLAPRRPDRGPQGFPVNRTAIEAGVVDAIASPAYRLTVSGGRAPLALTLADLHALPQRSATLPIACVEGWSASQRWTGPSLRDVLAAAGVTDHRGVDVHSLEASGRYASSTVPARVVADPDTLLALMVDGEQLAPDHGYPVRLIAPNRPGVLQTKWVGEVVVR